MGEITAGARRKARSTTPAVISPMALEAVRRIDALFECRATIWMRGALRRLICSRR